MGHETTKTGLHISEEHRTFIEVKARQDGYSSPDDVIAAAIDQMIEDDQQRLAVVDHSAEEIRRRLKSSPALYISKDDAFAAAMDVLSQRPEK